MDLYFDSDHDLTLSAGDLRFTEDDDDVKQRIAIYLQFLYDEWFISTSDGIPYTQTIFSLNASNIGIAYTIIRNELKNIEGVNTIDELELDLDGDKRELSISLTVNQNISVEVVI